MASKVLNDREVYDLVHEAYLLLSNKVVATEAGRSVLTAALRDLDVLQRALLIMTEGTDPSRLGPEQPVRQP
jgi:hypothetical protein